MSAFDNLYKSGPVVAIIRDPVSIWQVVSASESIIRVGIPLQSLPVDLLSYIVEEDHDLITRKLGAAIMQKRTEVVMRYRIKKDNQIKWVEDYCSLSYSPEDQVVACESLLWTTTLPLEWHLLSKSAEAWNLLNSKLRHDMLNQLTAILGYLELSSDMITDPMLLDFATKEQNAAERIREKLIFSREYQKIGLTESEWIKLSTLIPEVIGESGCSRFAVLTDIDDTRIFADKVLKQALIRIFENTSSHALQATEIKISFIRTPTGGTLIFEDNGPGIPNEQKQRIFDLGYGSGEGFGLFLAEKILAIFGITIVENGISGSGVRYELTIPGYVLDFTV